LAVRRSNPNVRMLMVVNLIDAMLTHPAQAAPLQASPAAGISAPPYRLSRSSPLLATARNNTASSNPVPDHRDTGIIANRAATVVNEIRILTWVIMIWSSLRYFCPPCFTVTQERPLERLGLAIHHAPGKRFHSLSVSPPRALGLKGEVTSVAMEPVGVDRPCTYRALKLSSPAGASCPSGSGPDAASPIRATFDNPGCRRQSECV
jgi:hypothetical protein